jgi:hypothetical protein
MKNTTISKLAAVMTALTGIFTPGTALAGHDHHDQGIDYHSLDRQAAAVMDTAHELACTVERENRNHRGHEHSANDARVLSYLKELERRIGHVHNAIHTRCSLPTIERRAEYAHRVADSTRQKVRQAGGLSKDANCLFEKVLTQVCALEESVAHADHGHARVSPYNPTRENYHRGPSLSLGNTGLVLNIGRR